MPRQTLTDAYARVVETLSGITLASDVEIPVYLIHNTPDAEDYTFLIDFERFLRESKSGLFARPVLKIWAGRSDFDRATFARNLREAFSHEFARMRAGAKTPKSEGWFSLKFNDLLSGTAAVHFVGTVVLYVAVTGGKMAAGGIAGALGLDRAVRWIRGDKASRIEADIAARQRVVDAALAETRIVLHRDLYIHAYRGTDPGPLTGIDHDAWPLPDYVTAHLHDRKTSSWW